MLDREHLQRLIPHQQAMCLLDSVISWDASRVHAQSHSHTRLDNPLRRHGSLSAVHLCEYGAQAMAVHGGLLAEASNGRARAGLLVSLRAVELHCATLDAFDGALDVHAEALLDAGESWQYRFRVEHAGALLAEGRAAVMLQPGFQA